MVNKKINLKGERIKLRSLRESDSKDIALYGNNKKIWKNLTDVFPSPYTQQKALKRIKKIRNKKDLISLGIISEGKLVGEVIASFREDVDSRKVFIAYWVGEPFWNNGIASEAVYLFTKFLFKNKDIKKVQARVFSWNEISKKVLEKNGFKLEGIMRKAIYKDKKYCDEYLYGIFRKELKCN